MKNRIDNLFVYQIVGLSNYGILEDGRIFEIIKHENGYETAVEIEKRIENRTVVVDVVSDSQKKVAVPVARLVLAVKYGDLPFPIKYLSGDYKDVSIDNLYYELPDPINKGKYLYIGSVEFKLIPEVMPYYYITSNGIVFNVRTNRLMRRSISETGTMNQYYRVSLSITPGNSKPKKIHQLVYRTWIGKVPKGKVIDHYDAKKYNNDVRNLRAITQGENSRAAHDYGIGNSVWDTTQVKYVCECLQNGGSVPEVAKILNKDINNPKERLQVKNLMISLRNGRVFKDITKHYNLYGNEETRKKNITRLRQKLDDDSVFGICKMILSGNSDNQIHKEYSQVSTSTIFNIRKGKQYYDIAIQYHGMKEYIEEKIKSLSA